MTRWTRIVREAYLALVSNRLRSMLMMLSIVIGVGTLAAVMFIGQGTREHALELVARHGLDMIMVRPGGTEQIFAPETDRTVVALSTEDTEAVASSIVNVQRTSSVQNERDWDVVYGDQTIRQRIFAVEPEWAAVRRRGGFRYGEMFSEANLLRADRVCVLGSMTAETLFGDENPVGQTVRIGNDPYQVVGVFNTIGTSSAGSTDWDFRIVIPLTTAAKRLFGRLYLEQIIVQVSSIEQLVATAEEIRGLLRQRHGIAPGAPDDFFVREPEDVEEAALDTSDTLSNLLLATSAIALLVGGLVIMNIMLLSVSERVQEIGLRRASGARQGDILAQFLIETLIVTLAGGVVGLIVGVAAASLLSDLVKIGWSPILVALVACAAVAMLSGIYPARKAAAVDPIVALRSV